MIYHKSRELIGIDMNLIEILDITSTNTLLIIANIVLIILAVFLLVKLRKSIDKHEEKFEPGDYLKKENETDLTGIADIKPEEFNPERFDLKKDFFTLATTPKTTPMEMGNSAIQAPATLSLDAAGTDAGLLKTDELELEDELLEEFDLSQVDSPEIPQPVKQEEKHEEEFVVPPEPEITVPETEEEKPIEKFIAPPEPEIMVPETEEEMPEEEFVVPLEPKITVPEKVEEIPKEKISAPPELKLFSLDDMKKPEEISAPPELKLFTLDETKKPEKISASVPIELLTPEKTGEQKEKKAKRKSLF